MKTQSRDVVIYGSGGLGREVLWTSSHNDTVIRDDDGDNWRPRILGFLDDNAQKHGSFANDMPIIGGAEWLASNRRALVLMAVGSPSLRRTLSQQLLRQGCQFGTLISAESIVSDYSTIGHGSIILPGAVISTNVSIGRFVLVNPTASVSHDGAISDFTSLGPGVSLAGGVRVGEACDIGTNASAVPGVEIGNNTIVGAGACVVEDLPGDMTVVGVPARPIK